MKPWQYILVDNNDAFRQMRKDLSDSSVIGLDTESGGPPAPRYKKGAVVAGDFINLYHPSTSLSGVSLADLEQKKAWYVPFGHYKGNLSLHHLQSLIRFLASHKGAVAIHNIKHELKVLNLEKRPENWHCTLVQAWVCGCYVPGKGLSLKDMSRHFLKWHQSTFGEATQGRTFNCLTPADGLCYAVEDAIAAAQLHDAFIGHMDKLGVRGVYDDEMHYPEMLAAVEKRGLLLDEAKMERLFGVLTERVKLHYATWYANCPNRKVDGRWEDTVPQLHEPPTVYSPHKRKFPVCESGINPASPTQMQTFFDLRWWPTSGVDATKSGYSTSAKDLAWIVEHTPEGSRGHKCAAALAEIKLVEKNRTTFTQGLLVLQRDAADRRLHGNLNQTGTKTGRLSSSGPNLQNLPAHSETGALIRGGIVASPGHKLVVADYSSLEYRIGAHYAGEGYLWDCYRAAADPHGETMREFDLDRSKAKRLNFMGFYGGGLGQYCDILGISKDEAKLVKAAVDDRFRHEQRVMRAIQDAVVGRGWVKNWFGFKRWLPDAQLVCPYADTRGHKKFSCLVCSKVAKAKRQASNMVMQGTGGSLTKRAMLAWHTMHGDKAAILLQVHDEIMLETEEHRAEEVAALLTQTMEQVGTDAGLKVPLVAEANIGNSWYEAK